VVKINCELCGKKEENLLKAVIESVELNVCKDCGKFGKVIGFVKKPEIKGKRKIYSVHSKQEEKSEILVEGFHEIIKKKRESLGLPQKDFALKINEKESLVHKIETGSFEPNLDLARKIERFLGIKIVEEYKESFERQKQAKDAGFTLGDFIKIRK